MAGHRSHLAVGVHSRLPSERKNDRADHRVWQFTGKLTHNQCRNAIEDYTANLE
jgi:hypothetical protein